MSNIIKKAVLFNGPPRSGKDTSTEILLNLISDIDISSDVLKFTKPVKDITHKLYGLERYSHDYFEDVKDTPLDVFNGKTPREAYIETSTSFREKYGFDFFAKKFVEMIDNSDKQLIVNMDVGYDYEAEAVVNALGVDNVLICKIHRIGHDFSNDCRSFVNINGVKETEIYNNSDKDMLRHEINKAIIPWLTDSLKISHNHKII